MRHTFSTVGTLACYLFLIAGCGKSPTGSGTGSTGTIDLTIRINRPRGLAKTAETTWDSLVVYVTASDMTPVRHAFAIDPYDGLVTESLDGVPAGVDRRIEAWTVNSAGDTIHGVQSVAKDIAPGQSVAVQLSLAPVRGSIYIQLVDLPSGVDSIYAAFIRESADTVDDKVYRSTRVYISLDNIPYGSSGTLVVAGVSAEGDTIGEPWRETGYTFTDQYVTFEASFVSIGKLSMEVTVAPAGGVTLVRGVFDTTAAGPTEGNSVPLLISEIMYAANDSEYVELYNHSADSVYLDTLIFRKDNGTYRFLEGVGVAAGGFFVIGEQESPWVDMSHPTNNALDLSSTGGWITILAADSSVIDWVSYDAGTNDLGWPGVSGKTSIALDSLPSDPEYNNYGAHWIESTQSIDPAATNQKGTPGAGS